MSSQNSLSGVFPSVPKAKQRSRKTSDLQNRLHAGCELSRFNSRFWSDNYTEVNNDLFGADDEDDIEDFDVLTNPQTSLAAEVISSGELRYSSLVCKFLLVEIN